MSDRMKTRGAEERGAGEQAHFSPAPLLAAAPLLLCLFLAGCGDPGIRVGSKNFTEGLILGEIITGYSNAKEVKATHRSALGGTQILFQALKKGDIDAYADYTGTIAWRFSAGWMPPMRPPFAGAWPNRAWG